MNEGAYELLFLYISGYSNALEGLSGGFVYGVGGSGLITPKLVTPQQSGTNTPQAGSRAEPLTDNSIDAAFGSRVQEAIAAGP